MFAGAECTGGWDHELPISTRNSLSHDNEPSPDPEWRAHFGFQIFLLPIARQPLRRSSKSPDQSRRFRARATSHLHQTAHPVGLSDHHNMGGRSFRQRAFVQGQPRRGRVIFPEIHAPAIS